MAVVAISDSILTDIADAIRSKNGTENTYKPSQMPDAIEAISGGGITPIGTKQISITSNGTTTEDVTNYASAEISVNVPTGSSPVINSLSVTENGTYTAPTGVDGYSPVTVNVQGSGDNDSMPTYLADTLTTLDNDNVTTLKKPWAFRGMNDLTKVTLKNLTAFNCGGNTFYESSNIVTVSLPKVSTFSANTSSTFGKCTSLTAVDLGFWTRIGGNEFQNCSALKTIILRNTSVVTLASTNAFDGSPFANGGSGGTIYVPSALVSSYQSASNWSTIYGYGTITFTAIEGSQYETATVDGSSISS